MVRQLAGLGLALTACGEPPVDADTPDASLASPRSFYLQNTESPHRLKSEDGVWLSHEVESGLVQGPNASRATRESWSNWGLLSDCVGHPLHPYLADPESILVWIDSAPAQWIVHYSGLNPCSLSGPVILDTHRDRVDVSQLRASGSLWSAEGRSRTLTLLRIQDRSEAITRYAAGDAASRILLLKKLAEDPDGRIPLQELLHRHPEGKVDLEQAILRHDSLFNPNTQKDSQRMPGNPQSD